jgi:hypothetical protein
MSSKSPEYYRKFDKAFEKELAFVKKRWEAKAKRRNLGDDPFEPGMLRGLALSGGGIRSASFCMGVVQQLHVAGVIDRLHYMSTVSGGGYTGASLTWFLAQDAVKTGVRFGTERDNFPFTGGEAAAVRIAAAAPPSLTAAPVDGRQVLDYIRQRSSYLNPGAGFTVVSAVAIVLRSILTAVFGFILLGAAAFGLLVPTGLLDRDAGSFVAFPRFLAFLGEFHWPSVIAFGLILLIGVSIVLYSLFTAVPGAGKIAYGGRRAYQLLAGKALALAVGLLLLDLLFYLIHLVSFRGLPLIGHDLLALGSASASLGTLGGIATRAANAIPSSLLMRLVMAVLPPVALFLLVTGLGVLAYELAQAARPYPWWLLPGVALVYALYTNINLTGLHRFYRDRLMETFMPDPAAITLDGQAAESTADDRDLADCCKTEHDGPFHLINTHVVLLGANKARQRSRGGDSFVLSPLFCGSEATGFIKTAQWMPGPASISFARRHGPLALPTAMAISGAALNPRAGADGQGLTKGGAVSALLNLLNLRLGYWVPSPPKALGSVAGAAYRGPPNFIFPGLVQGLFGFKHDEEASWLELSDGGHFENTGIYELVRRGVRTIIFADGSTDPDTALSSFANALEKIYIDFNVRVTFDEAADFTHMLKGMDTSSELAKRLNFSAAGFAIGTIQYPDVGGRPGPRGRLFYIKSTMVSGLPAALYSYKATNPIFPAESLADQFFSEQQFEAYRSLGFALTRTMIAFADDDRRKRPPIGYAESLGI